MLIRGRLVSAGPGQSVEQSLVLVAALLLGMELDHDVHAWQRSVEQPGGHAHAVDLVADRVPRGRHDQEPIAVGHPEVVPDGPTFVGREGECGLVRLDPR